MMLYNGKTTIEQIWRYDKIFLRIEEVQGYNENNIEIVHYCRDNNVIRLFDQPFIFSLVPVNYFIIIESNFFRF
jgi:hypothetical protein